MIRSFLAIEIPEAIRNKIYESFDRARRQLSGVKWVEPAVMHLTLQFLGEVDEELLFNEVIPRLEKDLEGEASLNLQISGVGLFPTPQKPRVFWLGVGGDGVGLKRLQSKMEKSLRDFPVHRDEKEFHAHLTLGRVKEPGDRKVWHRILEEYEKIDFGSFRVEEVILFKSELTRQGPNYTKLREFKLISGVE